jgi:hypothetical protein
VIVGLVRVVARCGRFRRFEHGTAEGVAFWELTASRLLSGGKR